MIYRKVRAGDYNVRYIDTSGKWWKQKMNGRLLPSNPMPIEKEYGSVELNVVDEGVFGLRIEGIEKVV